MKTEANTILLRLSGPMQSWGTSSRFQIRRTDLFPSKSGVLGLILCAMGVKRNKSAEILDELNQLNMGVRIDHPGHPEWDYHTAGAKIGIRSADGKIKKTSATGEYEAQLSRRQYLYDSSFLVALQGREDVIAKCKQALQNPAWPIFLGRKCCIPAEPVYIDTYIYSNVKKALEGQPWFPRTWHNQQTKELEIYLEVVSSTDIEGYPSIVYDSPVKYGYYNHNARVIKRSTVVADVGGAPKHKTVTKYNNPYDAQFKAARKERLQLDNDLCVFCKSPAADVHHIHYENTGQVSNDDLRSLCKLCHDACTSLEYSDNMRTTRIDPSDENNREILLTQINRILAERHQAQISKVRESVRNFDYWSNLEE